MSASPHPGFGMDALLKAREKRSQMTLLRPEESQVRTVPDVPGDAQILEPGRTVHAWDGEKFVPWLQWLAGAVRALGEQVPPAIPVGADRVVGTCGDVRVTLIREPGRWLMFVRTGSSKRATRRRDFASPSLDHGIAAAEQWYGVASDGWRAEKADGKTADLPSQGSTLEAEGSSERGRDGMAVDGQ